MSKTVIDVNNLVNWLVEKCNSGNYELGKDEK